MCLFAPLDSVYVAHPMNPRAIHMWIDLTIHLRTERTTILFAGSILFWVVLLWTWPKAKGVATILASPQ